MIGEPNFSQGEVEPQEVLLNHAEFAAIFSEVPLGEIKFGDQIVYVGDGVVYVVYKVSGDVVTIGRDIEGERIQKEVPVNDVRTTLDLQHYVGKKTASLISLSESVSLEGIGFSPQEIEQAGEWLRLFPDTPLPPDMFVDHEPELIEFDRLTAQFKKSFDVEALKAIRSYPSMPEGRDNPVRVRAKEALVPIKAQWMKLRESTNIPKPRLDEAEKEYQYITHAVGMLKGDGSVDHDR